MSEAPPFWFKRPGIAAWLLAPFGAIYGGIAKKRMLSPPKSVSKVPVFCIGNFIVGGAGKTPTAIALAKVARNMGLKPGFLSRGYGGSLKVPTVVDIKSHNARDVGDEPLILGLYATTVVSADRPAGAALLEEQGVDLILMDDGFQNPSLHKDFSLAVVDARRGIGNGFSIPAGPLRTDIKTQLAAANAVLLIGQSEAGTKVIRRAAKMAKPVLSASVKPRAAGNWNGISVLAFTGIADPQKFYDTLESVDADVQIMRSFADHHVFSAQDCRELLATAREHNLVLVTTEKDTVRLIRMGEAQQELREASKILAIDLEFENIKMVEMILRDTLKRAEEFRIK